MNPSYTGPRKDILSLVPFTAQSILDVGCSNGALGAGLKARQDCQILGVELDPKMAEVAQDVLDEVYVGPAEDFFKQTEQSGYDAIIFADVLEHLYDPWSVVDKASEMLAEGGVIIASLPNIRHISTVCNLFFRGIWPYKDRGLHDRTHLRFFTRRSILSLFQDHRCKVIKWKINYRITDEAFALNPAAKLFAVPGLKHFLAYQYLVVVQKVDA